MVTYGGQKNSFIVTCKIAAHIKPLKNNVGWYVSLQTQR